MRANTNETEDMMMQGFKQGYMNLRTWECKDARIQASTPELKYMRIRDANIQASAQGPKVMRMWKDEDEDVLLKMRRYKQVKYIEYVDYF